MQAKRWFAGVGVVVFAYLVAVFDMAFTWPRPVQPLRPAGSLGVSLTPFANGLDEPVAIAFSGVPTDTRMFVVERSGVIRIVQSSGTVLPTPFLDISPSVDSESYQEMGMLGLAFEPNYAATGRFYVYYTGPGSSGGNTLHLSRFSVSGNPDIADTTETSILTIDHPDNFNHDGGQLQFGPDGYLYLGPGDGGGGGDLPDNAQHTDRLLGKLLRLNVTGVPTYTIPASNPLTQTVNARGEVWAFGLRNPWRFSFDKQTGDLYIGDVGQDTWEEVDFQPAGAGGRNYGWHCYEGNHAYLPNDCISVTGLISPVAEYNHNTGGDAIMGGYVYRGSQYPSLDGYYFYADYGDGNFWAMRTCTWQVTDLGHLASNPSTFGQDRSGELYVASLSDGIIYRLVGPAAPGPAPLQTPLYLPLVQRAGTCS
jgi:glucose/arabinose dehydrogenase